MNFNHLLFVLEVANSKSFTKASTICCVTQPTLSNGIKQLEHQLGGELFNRTTRQVKLTPFGEHLLPSIKAISAAQQDLIDNTRLYFEPTHQLLSLGFSPLADMRIIDAIVTPFVQSNQQVHTYFKECFIEEIVTRLIEGKIDLAIRPATYQKSDGVAEYHAMRIYKEPVFVIPRDDPNCKIAGQGPIVIAEAANDIFALTPNICGHANATREWFAQEGKVINEYPGQAVSYQVMQDWANLGLASAILPWSKIVPEYRSKARPLFNGAQKPIFLEFELVWNKVKSLPQPLITFLPYCQEKLVGVIDGLHIENELFQPVYAPTKP